jgi:L-lactate dehydrogenase complex protein LldG
MSSARDEVLRRIQAALRDVPASERPEDVSVERSYQRTSTATRAALVAQFTKRVAEYRAAVRHVAPADLPSAIAAACAARGVRRLVVPTDLPDAWAPDGVELLRDAGLTNAQLDASDGVLTGCALGIAQTGTIVLDSGPLQGRRVLTLLPDYHLCVVRADQIVDLVPEAMTQLDRAVREERRPITFISGPSATSDIELNRVEGVHGPRTLEVLIVVQHDDGG